MPYTIKQAKDLKRAANIVLASKPVIGEDLPEYAGVCREISVHMKVDAYGDEEGCYAHIARKIAAIVVPALFGHDLKGYLPNKGVWTKERIKLIKFYSRTPAAILLLIVNSKQGEQA